MKGDINSQIFMSFFVNIPSFLFITSITPYFLFFNLKGNARIDFVLKPVFSSTSG